MIPAHHHTKQQSSKEKMSPVWLQVVFVVSVVTIIGVLSFLLQPKSAHAPDANTIPTITITTDDGIDLKAQLTLPAGSDHVPAVILAHEFSQDHTQWDPYVQDFVHAGFAVLTYDIRGFGESRLPTVPTDFTAWDNDMPKDVPAIMTYLRDQSRIDSSHISMVGAVLGANVAYVASGSDIGLYRVVLLSPSLTSGVLDGQTVEHFQPAGALGVSDRDGQSQTATVMATIQEPTSVILAEQPGSGVALLQQTDVLGSVLSWLKQ